MSAAVQLASTCSLPEPIERNDSHVSSERVQSPHKAHPGSTNSKVQVAPYQALPVAGPIITHHRSSAFNIMEPSRGLPEEVRDSDSAYTELLQRHSNGSRCAGQLLTSRCHRAHRSGKQRSLRRCSAT